MLGNSLHSSNQAQLYLGDLDRNVTELNLYNLLSRFGEVSMIKLQRDPSPYSKGYAFIGFKQAIDSNKARRELNGLNFLGTCMRVSRTTKDRDPKANVFVKNLPADMSLIELEDKFNYYGQVLSSKIVCDKNGVSLRYGFVQFERRDQAGEAIKALNGTSINGSVLSVCEFLPVTARVLEGQNNLYIKGFPLEYTQDTIKGIFSAFGNVVSVGIMTAKTKDGERAFGFVSFSEASSAKAACTEMHMKKTEEFEWYVVPHMKKIVRKAVLKEQYRHKIEEWKLKNLYMRNLPKSICEKKLKEISEAYGLTSSVKISRIEHITYNAEGEVNKEYSSKGVGFVCFVQESAASNALKDLQEKTIEGQKVFVARWKPRNELGLFFQSKALVRQSMRNWVQPVGQQAVPVGVNLQVPGLRSPPQQMPRSAPQRPYKFAPQMPPGNFRSLMPFTSPSSGRHQIAFKNVNVGPAGADEPQNWNGPAAGQRYYEKESIGEVLFPMVAQYSNELVAGKITGMMLEMGVAVLNRLIQDQKTLKEKVEEAVEVLRKAWQNNPAQLRLLPNSHM